LHWQFSDQFPGAKSSIAGLAEQEAGKYVSFYWGGAMVGRFVGAAVMQKIQRVKRSHLMPVTAAVLVLTTIDWQWVCCHVGNSLSVGLFNSIMFPTIFSWLLTAWENTQDRVPAFCGAAIVGGAILPVVQGFFC